MAVIRPVFIDTTTGELTRAASTDSLANEVDFLSVQNETGGALVIGTPVYFTGTANEVDKAGAGALATARVAGLVADVSIADTAAGSVLSNGRLTATTGQWDAVTGDTGGLTPGAKYYLEPGTAGMLTTTPPSTDGQVIAPVGQAVSSTVLSIDVDRIVVL